MKITNKNEQGGQFYSFKFIDVPLQISCMTFQKLFWNGEELIIGGYADSELNKAISPLLQEMCDRNGWPCIDPASLNVSLRISLDMSNVALWISFKPHKYTRAEQRLILAQASDKPYFPESKDKIERNYSDKTGWKDMFQAVKNYYIDSAAGHTDGDDYIWVQVQLDSREYWCLDTIVQMLLDDLNANRVIVA